MMSNLMAAIGTAAARAVTTKPKTSSQFFYALLFQKWVIALAHLALPAVVTALAAAVPIAAIKLLIMW